MPLGMRESSREGENPVFFTCMPNLEQTSKQENVKTTINCSVDVYLIPDCQFLNQDDLGDYVAATCKKH